MIHLRIHLIYVAIIGFLVYQYWTKETKNSTLPINTLFKPNSDFILESTLKTVASIEKNVEAYDSPNNRVFSQKAHDVYERTRNLAEWINNLKIRITEKNTLSEQEIQTLKDSLYTFQVLQPCHLQKLFLDVEVKPHMRQCPTLLPV